MPDDVVSVVPTFRPPDSVVGLISGLSRSGVVLVSDDGSPCSFDRMLRSLAAIPSVHVARHLHNVGIARALNEGLELARKREVSWLLTVDQDSELDSGYVEEILDCASTALGAGVTVGALGAEIIVDASGPITYPSRRSDHARGHVFLTEEVVQSGTVWHVPTLVELGGFSEALGMDAVDAEACLRLRENGNLIALAPGLSFRHRLGDARQFRVFGKQIVATRHPLARQGSMLANRARLFPREFRSSPKHALRTLRRVTVNSLVSAITAR